MRELNLFSAELDSQIRLHLQKYCNLPRATEPEFWVLRGERVTFYRSAWLGYVRSATAHASEVHANSYFVISVTEDGRSIKKLVPISRYPGAVARANRELRLTINTSNLLEYLHFYYRFTPREDAISTDTLFFIPRTIQELSFKPDGQSKTAISHSIECSQRCLALGSVWRFIDKTDHQRFVPTAARRKIVPYSRVSARIAVLFENSLFSADVRLGEATGVPALSSPELLFEGAVEAQCSPVDLMSPLPIPSYIRRREFWLDLRGSPFLVYFSHLVTFAIGLALALMWVAASLVSMLYPIAEVAGLSQFIVAIREVGGLVGVDIWLLLLGSSLYSVVVVAWFNWLQFNPIYESRVLPFLFGGRIREPQPHSMSFHAKIGIIFMFSVYLGVYLALIFTTLQVSVDHAKFASSGKILDLILLFAVQTVFAVPFAEYILSVPGANILKYLRDVPVWTSIIWSYRAFVLFVVVYAAKKRWASIEASPLSSWVSPTPPRVFYQHLRSKRG